MYDRIFAGVLVVLSGLIAWTAYQFDVPFQYEPLGPKAFPIILSALLALASLWLLVKPSADDWHPSGALLGKLLGALVLMYVYASLYAPVGFIIATTLVGGAFSWLFGEKLVKSGVYALSLSVVSFFVLTKALQLNVPVGTIFGG